MVSHINEKIASKDPFSTINSPFLAFKLRLFIVIFVLGTKKESICLMLMEKVQVHSDVLCDGVFWYQHLFKYGSLILTYISWIVAANKASSF